MNGAVDIKLYETIPMLSGSSVDELTKKVRRDLGRFFGISVGTLLKGKWEDITNNKEVEIRFLLAYGRMFVYRDSYEDEDTGEKEPASFYVVPKELMGTYVINIEEDANNPLVQIITVNFICKTGAFFAYEDREINCIRVTYNSASSYTATMMQKFIGQ
jgi:hypothetical protein